MDTQPTPTTNIVKKPLKKPTFLKKNWGWIIVVVVLITLIVVGSQTKWFGLQGSPGDNIVLPPLSSGETRAPTAAPTNAPTAAPTNAPTAAPTNAPTAAPTNAPTAAPTNASTAAPTNAPTAAPTNAPTAAPTNAPTAAPTFAPCVNKIGPLCEIFNSDCADPNITGLKDLITNEMFTLVGAFLDPSDPLNYIEWVGYPGGVSEIVAPMSGVYFKYDIPDSVLAEFFALAQNSPGYSKFDLVHVMTDDETVKLVTFVGDWNTTYTIDLNNPIRNIVYKFQENLAYTDLIPVECVEPPTAAPTVAPTAAPTPSPQIPLCNNNLLTFTDIGTEKVRKTVNWETIGYLGVDMIIVPTAAINTMTETKTIMYVEAEEEGGFDDDWKLTMNVDKTLGFRDSDFGPAVSQYGIGTFEEGGVYQVVIHIGERGDCFIYVKQFDNLVDRNVISTYMRTIGDDCMSDDDYYYGMDSFFHYMELGDIGGVVDIIEVNICGATAN